MMDNLLLLFIKCAVGIRCDKPYCDITEIATRVTKEKQSGHLTPRCAHAVTRGQFWDNFEHLNGQYLFIYH